MKRTLRTVFCWCLMLAAASACQGQPETERRQADVFFGTLKDLDLANGVLYMNAITINQRERVSGVIAFQIRPNVMVDVNIERRDRNFQGGKTLFDLVPRQWIWISSLDGKNFDSVRATSYKSFRGVVKGVAKGPNAYAASVQVASERVGSRRGTYAPNASPRKFQIPLNVPCEYGGEPMRPSLIRSGMEVEILTAFGEDVVKVIVTKTAGGFSPRTGPKPVPEEETESPVTLPLPVTPAPPVVPPPATPPVVLPPVTPPVAVTLPAGRIVFHSNRDGNDEIYSMRADGSEQVRLTNNKANDGGAIISPDGRLITFTSNRDGNLEVYAMNDDGSNQYRVTNNAGSDIVSAWSPNGEYLAFYSNRNGNYDIFITDVTGGMLNSLTENSKADDIEPSYSPDGQRIAFCSKREGNYEIYVMDVRGGRATRLTSSTLPDREPTWSPDGKKIAWTRREGESNENIFLMNADGSDQRRLTEFNGKDVRSSFSADGKRIVFASDRNGNMEVYTMDLNGANVKQLTENLAGDLDPYVSGVTMGGR